MLVIALPRWRPRAKRNATSSRPRSSATTRSRAPSCSFGRGGWRGAAAMAEEAESSSARRMRPSSERPRAPCGPRLGAAGGHRLPQGTDWRGGRATRARARNASDGRCRRRRRRGRCAARPLPRPPGPDRRGDAPPGARAQSCRGARIDGALRPSPDEQEPDADAGEPLPRGRDLAPGGARDCGRRRPPVDGRPGAEQPGGPLRVV